VPGHNHHSLLQRAPAGPDRDPVVARSRAVVAPPPLLLPEMPSPTIRRLDVASPVPADIDIANSVEPLGIADIAAELGLGPEHYDLYGKYKAKVRS
jgi:formate--tetrahydrofolate ligase